MYMQQYRINVEHLKKNNPDLFYVPTPIKEIFEQVVQDATKEELVELLCLMCNESDWDSIAHNFL